MKRSVNTPEVATKQKHHVLDRLMVAHIVHNLALAHPRPLLQRFERRAKTRQMPSPTHRPTRNPTDATKPTQRASSTPREPHELLLWPKARRITWSPVTSDRQFRRPAPRGGLSHEAPKLRISGLPAPCGCQNCTVDVAHSSVWCSIAMERRHQLCQLRAARPQMRKAVCHDLESALIACVRDGKVQISYHHVRGDPSTSFSTYSGACTFHCKPAPAQHPCYSARCAMMPSESRRRPYRHERAERGRGRRKRRRSKTLNKWESIRCK